MRRAGKSIVGILVALVIIVVLVYRGGRGFVSISPERASAMIAMDSTTVLLDVRAASEYRSETGHLAGAILIPVDSLRSRIDEFREFRHRPLIVYCRSGARSARASAYLAQQGFAPLNLEGGIVRWVDEGYPVIIEKEN